MDSKYGSRTSGGQKLGSFLKIVFAGFTVLTQTGNHSTSRTSSESAQHLGEEPGERDANWIPERRAALADLLVVAPWPHGVVES
jgi:hypothetical protein